MFLQGGLLASSAAACLRSASYQEIYSSVGMATCASLTKAHTTTMSELQPQPASPRGHRLERSLPRVFLVPLARTMGSSSLLPQTHRFEPPLVPQPRKEAWIVLGRGRQGEGPTLVLGLVVVAGLIWNAMPLGIGPHLQVIAPLTGASLRTVDDMLHRQEGGGPCPLPLDVDPICKHMHGIQHPVCQPLPWLLCPSLEGPLQTALRKLRLSRAVPSRPFAALMFLAKSPDWKGLRAGPSCRCPIRARCGTERARSKDRTLGEQGQLGPQAVSTRLITAPGRLGRTSPDGTLPTAGGICSMGLGDRGRALSSQPGSG